MVRPTYQALSVLALALVPAFGKSVPSFEIPSFDYSRLHEQGTPQRVLAALQAGGILALSGIPNFTSASERYLAKAVDCAVAMESDGHSEHLSTKQFKDGTRRLTLRASAGRELANFANSEALASKCPGYHREYVEFSCMLERAVESMASALDQTELRLRDGEKLVTPRQLFVDAVRLDHFHAYEASTTPQDTPVTERELSLSLHEDHGMFIAMVAPEFFDVTDGNQLNRRRLESEESGLIIRKLEDGTLVRPVLKSDELVLMAGTGFSQWMNATHEIPGVMHGMLMPPELVGTQAAGHRHLRAWFGKMTLLPPHQRMLAGIAFDEFTNSTARLLRTGSDLLDAAELQSIGCAGRRRLVADEGSCAFRYCTPKPEFIKPDPRCATTCNIEFPDEWQVNECVTKCDCTRYDPNASKYDVPAMDTRV